MQGIVQGMLVRKIKMSQAISEDAKAQAITVLLAQPNVITQVKNPEKDGYFSLQLGLPGVAKPKKNKPSIRIKREFRFPAGEYKVGDQIVTTDIFQVGDTVDVSGITKGHGFSGTIKRHGFSRGPMTHGHDHHRAPGSIGAMGLPNVPKGRRMSGHFGNVNVTIKNLKVVAVDPANHLIAVSGSVPGHTKRVLIIKKQATAVEANTEE